MSAVILNQRRRQAASRGYGRRTRNGHGGNDSHDAPTRSGVPQLRAQAHGLADRTLRLAVVRFVFTAYLLLITVGLAFYIAIGITNPQ